MEKYSPQAVHIVTVTVSVFPQTWPTEANYLQNQLSPFMSTLQQVSFILSASSRYHPADDLAMFPVLQVSLTCV